MFKKIFKKIKGRDAKLIVDGEYGPLELEFKNNYSMMKILKFFQSQGRAVKIVYKRKEWLKQLIRLYWFFVTIYTIYIIIFRYNNRPIFEIYFIIVLIFAVINFKKFVITLDY